MDNVSPASNPQMEENEPAISQDKDKPDRQGEGMRPQGRILEAFYGATARWPLAVLLANVLLSAVLIGLPFVLYSNPVTIELSLDSYRVAGNDIANRAAAIEAAFCRGPCTKKRRLLADLSSDGAPPRRAQGRGPSSTTVVYAAKDGGNVLTEERLRQALELENRAKSILGSVQHTALKHVFPAYPHATGAPSGAALNQRLVGLAEQVHDSRNHGNGGPWPSFDKNFTACSPQSKLLSSTFSASSVREYAAGLFSIESEDLYLAFFESHEDYRWFSSERDDQIGKDTMLLIGVFLGVFFILVLLTSSFFVSAFGVLGILLATGVAFFWYRVLASGWFGILNAFAFFLLMGIGCDDIFVMVDTWRQSTELRGVAPDDYIGRLRYTLPRAGKAVATTSLTTAVAFFGNAISVIPPLRLFGIFSGLMVIFDFALTILFLPAVLVLQQKLFGSLDCQISWCRSPSAGKAGKVDSFLVRKAMPRLVRAAPVLVIVSAILAGISLNLALELPPGADFHESELFPSSHNQVRVHKAQQLMKNLRPQWVSVSIVHGVKPADTSDRNDPSAKSDVVWDEAFDIYQPEVQQFTLDLCRALVAERGLVRRLNRCWAEEMRDHLIQDGRPFPVTSHAEMEQALRRYGLPRGLKSNGEGRYWTHIHSTSTVEDGAAVPEFRVYHDRWEAFMNKWNDEAKRRGLVAVSNGFQTAGRWHHMTTIENLATSSISAIMISTAFVCIMLTLMFRNIAIVGFIMVHIMGICLALISCIYLEGRSLGVLESIALTLMVGLSVDYLSHLASAYLEEPQGKSRVQLVTAAVAHLGSSVLAGALTTMVAAVFLCFGTITFFSSFGIFILEMIGIAVFATLVSFASVLSLFGPEGGCCQIPLPRCCRSEEPAQPAADALADEVEVVVHPKRTRWLTAIAALLILAISGGVRLGLSLSDSGTTSEACPAIASLDIDFNNYQIPSDQDSYRCRGFDLIPSGCTYYITEIEPMVKPATLHGVVHHMILFATETQSSTCPFTCFDMPDATGMDAAWAVGMGTVRWPAGTGYALGGHKQALQMHYENMARRGDLVDGGSGLRLKLTQTQPQNVLTNIMVGLHPLGYMNIPPRRSNHTVYIECQPVLRGSITVIAFATHAHKVAFSIVTQVLRQSAIAGDAGSTPNYDFNYQSIEQFVPGQERQLLPGDVVRVICSYNTLSRSQSTSSGWGSDDEMCMTFLFAYPSSNVGNTNCIANRAFAL